MIKNQGAVKALEQRFLYEFDKMSLPEKFRLVGELLGLMKTEYEWAMVNCIDELMAQRGLEGKLLYARLGAVAIEVNGTKIIVSALANQFRDVIVEGNDEKALELAKEIAGLTGYNLRKR